MKVHGKMVSNSQVMDNQRQQYIPGPPPPPATQPHLMHLPPPPPRPHPQVTQSNLPPPPPGPHPGTLPPGTIFGIPGGWQQSWGRPSGLPPPPPLVNPNPKHNQHLSYSSSTLSPQRPPAKLAIPPPPPQYDRPLVSATFIPGGDSFGPGVGIPPLEDSQHSSYSRYDNYSQTEHSRSTSAQQQSEGSSDGSSYQYNPANQPYPENTSRETLTTTPAQRNLHNLHLPLHITTDPVSPGPPTATRQAPQNPPATETQRIGVPRHNTDTTSLGSPSPLDPASQWPLDRVLTWLSTNGFSSDWLETFKVLGLQGADFMELGSGANGRGNLSRMHQVVYPQLLKVCSQSKTGWDQSREREEGKRMRKLIRRLANNRNLDSATTTNGVGHQRRESGHVLPSASADGNVEDSPNVSRPEQAVTPSTAGTEGSPGKQLPAPLSSGQGSQASQQSRSSTMPVYSKHGSHGSTPSHHGNKDSHQSHRNVLNTLGQRGRHSPNPSADASTSSGGLASHSYQGSPHGSPALGHASPNSAGVSSPSPYPYARVEHSKSHSTDSMLKAPGHPLTGMYVPGQAELHRPGMTGPYMEATSGGRLYEGRRNDQDSNRPSPIEDGRHHIMETTPTGKEQDKGFFSKFMNRKKHDGAHPSPEDQLLESPTSPAFRQNVPNMPFIKPGANNSDASLLPRPASASTAQDEERQGLRSRAQSRSPSSKKFIFVTPDHWNYRLIDVTDIMSALALRNVICLELGIPDVETAHIFLTEAGQANHDDPLSDSMLLLHRRTRTDNTGSLKLYVRSPASAALPTMTPASAGLGLSFAERAQLSPPFPAQINRRPLDEETYARLVSKAQAGVSSIVSVSENSGLRDRGLDTVPRGRQAPLGLTGGAEELHPSGREELIQKGADDFRRSAEQKQKLYQESRQGGNDSANKSTGNGVPASPVLDFDSPRESPYEEKKTDMLVPLRKPPTAPSESNTLTKVNSLSRKSGERLQGVVHADPLKRISDPIIEKAAARGKRKTSGSIPLI